MLRRNIKIGFWNDSFEWHHKWPLESSDLIGVDFPSEAKCETQFDFRATSQSQNVWSRKANAHKCAIESQQPEEVAIDNMSKLRSLIFIISFIAFNWCLPLACPSDGIFTCNRHHISSCLTLTRIPFDTIANVLSFDDCLKCVDLLLCCCGCSLFDLIPKLNGSALNRRGEEKKLLCLWLWIVIHSRFIFRFGLLLKSTACDDLSRACLQSSTCFNLILIEFRWNLLVCKVIVMFLSISIVVAFRLIHSSLSAVWLDALPSMVFSRESIKMIF